MKILISILIYINLAFCSSENVSLMNAVKDVIQKEEYISIAINKYILQTATIPKKSDNTLDWTKLETAEYLGTNFNKINPLTKADIVVVFDATNNSAFIKGAFETVANYNAEYNYLYNFYTNKVFRVNTIPPINITKEKLVLGSQILYNDIQKEIVTRLNETTPKEIKFPNQTCTSGKYFYELANEGLTYKYCKSDNTAVQVYQEEPIYTENEDDLKYIIAEIGAKAYVKIGTAWYEKYFIGVENGSSLWSASANTNGGSGDPVTVGNGESIEQKILSYIPNSKDLMLRRDGGCMLANGDVFCWGNNQYKKAGIETYGQLDTKLTPYYVNTPVMLKVQINDTTQNSIKWYNNPYRVKFQKMAMNSTNVCAISPIFVGTSTKTGGDLYCNGQITSGTFENISSGISETSILSRNKYFADKTTNKIYLKDIAMVEDTIAVLTDEGKIFTIGRNYLGALGRGKSSNDDKFIIDLIGNEVTKNSQGTKYDNFFVKIFALRDLKTFGAIDRENQFYIWGERPNGTIYYMPTLLADGKKFNADAIFTNSKEFLLKGIDGIFYKTNNDLSVTSISSIPSTAISASIYDTLYLYANNKMELGGSNEYLSCKETGGANCDNVDKSIFNASLSELNTVSATTNYANFTNISIYQLDTIKYEILENYEDGKSTGWTGSSNNSPVKVTKINDNGDKTRIVPTSFLGRFSIGNGEGYNAGPSYIEKTFDLSSYKNNEVEIEFDFYEIDTWDYEKFIVTVNGIQLVEDSFVHDDHPVFTDSNDTGQYLQPIGASGSVYTNGDESYHYKLKSKVPSTGKLKLRFTTRGLTTADKDYYDNAVAQGIDDESWGIDNVHIKVKETSKTFVCAVTGLKEASQMYCWGNVGRSIPILSTSLYDVSKISTINKLFISQESDKITPMSFNNYNNSGNLFLKYPTYIGGFDYPFYFK